MSHPISTTIVPPAANDEEPSRAIGADPDRAVRERYAAAAQAREVALCCPVDYDPRLLEIIPDEVVERDYGCGDPSRYVREGDTVLDLGALESEQQRLRTTSPLIADGSVDLVVSNCVLNLVREQDKTQLVREIFRVLKRGGRIAISDIVSDEPVHEALMNDPELWSGCISGAFQEQRLLGELERAGFHGIAIDKWEHEPFAVVDGIEFRSVTVTARKGKQGPCFEANQAVVYAGPWRRVEDDDGHVLERGVRTAVCAKTFDILTNEPYASETIGIEPRVAIPEEDRAPFDCSRATPRDPRESKGETYDMTRTSGGCC